MNEIILKEFTIKTPKDPEVFLKVLERLCRFYTIDEEDLYFKPIINPKKYERK